MSHHASKTALPPEVAEAFATSAATTVHELTQLESKVDEHPQGLSTHHHIVAVVRLLRPVPGTFILALATETARRLAEKYLPAGTNLTDAMIDDVVGEFANVIAGQAKTILKGTPYHFALSIPSVGRDTQIAEVSAIASAALVGSVTVEGERLALYLDLTPCQGA